MTTLKKLPEKIVTRANRQSAGKRIITGVPDLVKEPEKLTQSATESPLTSFFFEELKYIYCTELHLLQVLPILHTSAHSEALKIALTEHLFQTEMHVVRLQEVFALLNKKPETKKCLGIEGITKETFETIETVGDIHPLRDVAIIMGSQKAEHFEIASYGSLKQLALTLERKEIADLLSLTLAEEKAADELLTELATRNANIEAQALP